MADCRIKTWQVKTGKARKTHHPQSKSLSPTSKSFELKPAYFQCAVWYLTMDPHHPKLDPTKESWKNNVKMKTLSVYWSAKRQESSP